jgi:hypothetical protein
MDVDTILATPIRPEFEDYPAWHFDNKGMFSVKSAYKVYVRLRDSERGAGSGSVNENIFWKQLWKIPCIPKVKQFLWRLTHNSLPLRANIGRRGIKCDTLCACCRRVDEDGAHLFLKCKETKEIWTKLGLGELCSRLATYDHAGAVIHEILSLNDEQKLLSACLLWRCWLRRNKLNKGEKASSVAETISEIKYWIRESSVLGKQRKRGVGNAVHWQAPEGDTIKINTDRAFDCDTRTGGWGFIARDATGSVRGAGAGRVNHAGSALQTEAVACAKALQAAADWGMSKITIETDALNLVSALKSS